MKHQASLKGEVSVLTSVEADETVVPFAPGVDVDALKSIDDDPMFVTVSIKPGKGDQGRGPNYGSDVLKDLEQQINTKRPTGYKGHQDPNAVEWQYREPVTAWLGAKYDGDKLFIKGYVPTTAPDLREQLALAQTGADLVNSVSIFGVRDTKGDEVVDFDLWSVDWTPKGRAGMETSLVEVSGEQSKEDDVTREEVIASLRIEDLPTGLVEGIQKDALSDVEGDLALAGEMRIIFESEDGDSDAVITAARELIRERDEQGLATRVDEALAEAGIAAEMAREAVREATFASVSVTSTSEEIAGEITAVRKRPYIKELESIPVVNGGRHTKDGERIASQWQ